jgi:hypothetical protein
VGIRLEPGQRFGFHNFRHSLATFLINKGKCYDCYDPDAAADVIGVLSLSDTSYQPAYKSGVDWDFATGIGTVKATNLVLNPVWAEGMTQ